jgi:hypothetical protein
MELYPEIKRIIDEASESLTAKSDLTSSPSTTSSMDLNGDKLEPQQDLKVGDVDVSQKLARGLVGDSGALGEGDAKEQKEFYRGPIIAIDTEFTGLGGGRTRAP